MDRNQKIIGAIIAGCLVVATALIFLWPEKPLSIVGGLIAGRSRCVMTPPETWAYAGDEALQKEDLAFDRYRAGSFDRRDCRDRRGFNSSVGLAFVLALSGRHLWPAV